MKKQQQGTHSTKPIVRLVPQWECGMGRKPRWWQKGTGRAWHEMYQGAHISFLFGVILFSLDGLQMSSDIIYWSQQFRDGATMHGLKPQSHALKLQEGSPARPVDCNFSSCSRREGKRLLWVRNDGVKIVETSVKVIMIVETCVKGNIM